RSLSMLDPENSSLALESVMFMRLDCSACASSADADGAAISVDLPAKPALYSSTSESETR
ncbi:MAG: hypothetical protein ACPHFO_08455, partial [Acidimicrobiales bacterium]